MLKKITFLQKVALVLFGLCLAIVILETGLRLGGFVILSVQEYKNWQSIKQKGSFRIICLGESTTQGQYPPYLEEILNQSNIKMKFGVIDEGVGGTRTDSILSQLEANLDKYQPNMVVAMMGINDAGIHMPYEADCSSKLIMALRSFRVYKLTRLLGLHIERKLKEIKSRMTLGKKQAVERLQQNISKDKVEDVGELNSNNGFEYLPTGYLFRDQVRSDELEQLCKKAIELKPNDESVYIQLGWFYADRLRFAEAEQLFKKAAEIKPGNDSAYIELASFFIVNKLGRLVETEQYLKKAIELNPNNSRTLDALGSFYSSQGKLAEAEQCFKKAIELDPNNNSLYGSLALVYSEIGNKELFNVYAEKANNLIDEYYILTTVNNYHKLKQILDKRKIRLVCAQYPMRNVKPLKKIFGEKKSGSIVFVDNERIFKDAVRKEGYKEYFVDMFGGNFGHCTGKGNELLARNIANTILKEVFDKK